PLHEPVVRPPLRPGPRLAPRRLAAGHRRDRLHRRVLDGARGHPVHVLRPVRRAAGDVCPPRRDGAGHALRLPRAGLWRGVRRQPPRGRVSAYLPTAVTALWPLAAILAATLAAGLAISRRPGQAVPRAAAWSLVAASTTLVERLTAEE